MYAHECRPRRIELARPGQALASLGLEPLVIPGEIEGALTFLGVAQDFLGQRILVADNGGGSTELACGTLDGSMLDLTFVRSTNVGCRRLTELFLSRTDPPSTADVAEAHAFAARLFSPVVSEGGLHCGGKGLLPRSWSRAVRRRVSWPSETSWYPTMQAVFIWPRSLRMTSSASRVVSRPSRRRDVVRFPVFRRSERPSSLVVRLPCQSS